MNGSDADAVGRRLSDLAPDAPEDFALRVLRRVGVPEHRYDTYVRLETAAGGLFVAASSQGVTGASLESAGAGTEGFEELHRARTGRSAIAGGKPFPGVVPALRTGRAQRLAIELSVPPPQRAILAAVRKVPAGQLRPVGWIAREADPGAPPSTAEVLEALEANPVTVLVPCHRVTDDGGIPCDAAYPAGVGAALRSSEDIDMERMAELSTRGAMFLGSDTTSIYCHPTCAHARRITPGHRVPFRTAREARRAGYRACKSCRPVTA